MKRKKSQMIQIGAPSAPKSRLMTKTPETLPATQVMPKGEGNTDITTPGESSFLVEDTVSMDRARRLLEQAGHRRVAKVHAREHPESTPDEAAELEAALSNNMLQHPWLSQQRFDGTDPHLNPEPPLNTDARREFDNERREQEMEKQLRLGLQPAFNTSPTPKPER